MGFWIFISALILAQIYQETAQQTSRARLLQAALEKGQDLDPQLLERMFPAEGEGNGQNAKDPRRFRIAAVVLASLGLGLGVLALAVRQIHINHFWVCLGLGGLTLVVSVGLFIASRMSVPLLPSNGSSLHSQT